jgi:hypothetical protein
MSLVIFSDEFRKIDLTSARTINSSEPDALERHRAHLEQAAESLALEHVSLSLDPAERSMGTKSLIQITMSSSNKRALIFFVQRLDAAPWSL